MDGFVFLEFNARHLTKESHCIAGKQTRIIGHVGKAEKAEATKMGKQGRMLMRERISPSAAPVEARTVPLSILDNTAARFTYCSAIWSFHSSHRLDFQAEGLPALLKTSLQRTLSSYPAWAGQLHWDLRHESEAGRRTGGRLLVTYGSKQDPGVDFVVVEESLPLARVCPSVEERKTTKQVWREDGDLTMEDLQPDHNIAIMDDPLNPDGMVATAIRITRFSCGGWAVCIRISHVLADASSMTCFMREWGLQTQVLLGDTGAAARIASPVFAPELLDAHARPVNPGDLDPDRVRLARSMPMHRFDWWAADAEGYPAWATEKTAVTKALALGDGSDGMHLTAASPAPWLTWDSSRPAAHAQIRFSARELVRMKEAARGVAGASTGISRLDALLLHVWSLINRARGLSESDQVVSLNVTLGARTRVQPALPETFIGSPTFIVHLSAPAKEIVREGVAKAGELRQTMQRFTPEVVAAHLHDAAHDTSPQRLWQTFVGSRHLVVTSWSRLQSYNVDFDGSGGGARYVQGVMPCIDGCMAVYDLPGDTQDMDVGLDLEAEALEKLLADPALRAFA